MPAGLKKVTVHLHTRATGGHQRNQNRQSENLENRFRRLDGRNKFVQYIVPEILSNKKNKGEQDRNCNERDDSCTCRRTSDAGFALKCLCLGKGGRAKSIIYKILNSTADHFLLEMQKMFYGTSRTRALIICRRMKTQIVFNHCAAMTF